MKIKKSKQDKLVNTTTSAERLPTNTLSHKHMVQRWANFIAGYSVEFVEKCLKEIDQKDAIVVDPFLGCGTTLVVAKNFGFRGVGFDRHPIFYSLAKAKLENYTIEELDSVKYAMLNSENNIKWSDDAVTYLSKLFTGENLDIINSAAAAIDQFSGKLRYLSIAFFLKSCEASCGAQTDGIYKAPTSTKKHIPFQDAIERAYSMFEEDINSSWYQDQWSVQPDAVCYNKSSTNLAELEDDSVSICITSPPYLNNFDYAEMTRMHLYLLGWAGSWREISDTVRNELITNTTTALKNKKTSQNQINNRATLPENLRNELDAIVTNLQIQRKERAGKKEYDYLIYLYYSEIKKVLTELFRSLKSGGEVHWIVADAALYGIHIKTHLHTASIMEDIGFSDVRVDFVRKRGHRWILKKRDGAKESLGEYHIKATKKDS